MNKNKFRIWNHKHKQFQEMDLPQSQQQFIGILDRNLKKIYEGDVVKGIYGLEGIEIIGEVKYSYDLCAYIVDWYHEISNMELDSLEVIGNMVEDYMWDESGEKLVKIHEDTNS